VSRCFILPRLLPCEPPESSRRIWVAGLTIGGACMVSSYVAAILIHLFILPGFLGSVRAVIVSGMFTVLFSLLFGGISYAIVFYRHSVDRARAVEQMRAELAEAELRALRAQIHPHFLFNTLNTIAALIPQDPAAAEETLTRLAEMFRYTLQASEREYSSLDQELDFVRSYLEIERTRFGDRLTVRESIEPGLSATPVPSLLLQPLVENAVRYAVAPRSEGGVLSLTVRRQGETLVLEVGDDGPGLQGAAPSGNGFGLRSVRERLQLAGPPHALEVLSGEGPGTRVRVTLPLVPRSAPAPSAAKGVTS
jgi:LytS/YehU family sensor histidine kinase